MSAKPSFLELKVASANINVTMLDLPGNVELIEKAIDKAVEDGANVLSLQEMVLTGYSGDDDFKQINSPAARDKILGAIRHLAEYANTKDPNLLLSVGFPLWYEDKDKDQPVTVEVTGADGRISHLPNPLYNVNNRPFNAQAFISGGKVHGISLKSMQPDGMAEYEPRQFTPWPDYMPVQQINLPKLGKEDIPVGHVLVKLAGKNGEVAHVYHEMCAEAWPGIYDDGHVNWKEVYGLRHLSHLAEKNDVSLVLNPSASKPQYNINKPSLRAKLSKIGSMICKGAAYVYSASLGLESAPVAFEGGSIFVEDERVVHHSARYSMSDVEYASKIMKVPVAEKGEIHATIEHDFTIKGRRSPVGGLAGFEKIKDKEERKAEEAVRNTALWIRDYLKKTGSQGFVVSLSGGADSAFGAVAIIQAIDLNIRQLEEKSGNKKQAVADFINQFPHLKYKDEVLAKLESSVDEAIALIKEKMLTCIYLKTDNSSDKTQEAARTLIKGNDEVKGIGGKFEVLDVQLSVNAMIEIFAGVVHSDLLGKTIEYPRNSGKIMGFSDAVRIEFKEYVAGARTEFSPEIDAVINNRDQRRWLSWRNEEDDLTLQNIQARARQPYPWIIGNKEHKIACVTSNWSEAAMGYWTFGGDGHMGGINLCGGIPKSDLKRMLKYIEHKGLDGVPIPSLALINNQQPTAELKPQIRTQTDEGDLGMTYEMVDAIVMEIFINNKSPIQAYKALKKAKSIDHPGTPLFVRAGEDRVDPEYLEKCIEDTCRRFSRAQFKRVGSVISPFLGFNLDPHTSTRTTIINEWFRGMLVDLRLVVLDEITNNRHHRYEKKFSSAATVDIGVRTAIEQAISFESLRAGLDGMVIPA